MGGLCNPEPAVRGLHVGGYDGRHSTEAQQHPEVVRQARATGGARRAPRRPHQGNRPHGHGAQGGQRKSNVCSSP